MIFAEYFAKFETILQNGKRAGKSNQDGAPLRLKISAEPASQAAKGKTGVGLSVDYRGEDILTAYTHISKTGWGFVTKVLLHLFQHQ